MLKYKCLIFDYDDTLVRSTSEIHYPAFLYTIEKMRPGRTLTLDEYNEYDFKIGFIRMYKEVFGFSDEEVEIEEQMWRDFAKDKSPDMFDGLDRIIRKQKEEGGLVCVMSHNLKEVIKATFDRYNLPTPDVIYGWDEKEFVKPKPNGVYDLMKRFNLEKSDIILVDDLRPGYLMAKETEITFAYPGWAETKTKYIVDFMKENADVYPDSPTDLYNYLFK